MAQHMNKSMYIHCSGHPTVHDGASYYLPSLNALFDEEFEPEFLGMFPKFFPLVFIHSANGDTPVYTPGTPVVPQSMAPNEATPTTMLPIRSGEPESPV